MESKQPPKKTRGRSKSSSVEAPAPAPEEEMAPNLNGNKDGGTESEPVPEAKQDKQPEQKEAIGKTRKRKAAELRSDEASSPEPPRSLDDEPKEVMKEAAPKDTPIEFNESLPLDTDIKVEDESSANDSSSELKDVVPPEKNLLGKGKRARVPNKRYSDIVPLKYDSPKSKSTENGQFQENEPSEIFKEEPETDSLNTSLINKRATASSPGGPPLKKQKTTVDLSNPNYLKPFQFGWKRELVYRANTDNTLKRNGDIYYYTPNGKKVRSMREVAENLKNKELSIDDFTFFKEPLGVDDPEKEIIRDAKFKTAGTPIPKKMSTKISKTPKMGSPKNPGTPVSSDVPKAAKSPRVGGFKVKLPKSASKKDKKPAGKEGEGDMEIGTYPPNWTSPKKGKTNKRTEVVAKTRLARARKIMEKETKSESSKFMDTYLQNLAYGYKTLLCVFQYLKVQDLLRAGCVCTMWRDVARHPILWNTVRMKNSQIHSFEGLANALQQHGSVHLDLRKMLLPTNGGDDIWPSFTNAIKKVESLRKIELCRCLASVVEELANNNHNLEAINAVTIKCESMSFEPFKNLKNLTDLRIKSTAGLTLTSDLSALKELTNLKHLSITSIKDLNKLNIEVIGELINLEVLDIGECADFPKHFGPDILSKLVKLEKLRLEKGQGECYTFEMLDAVKDLANLQQLELVNFDIKAGFDKALGSCLNIKKLLIIPTYISQSATTNHMVLGGVLKLQKTLSHFVWGVTLELLRVTELFVDQCEHPDKKEVNKEKSINNGDSIPVLKPVPLLGITQTEAPPTSETPQVEILPLPNLQKLLLQNLPTTRVKILKIPFHATWRQSITDSVN